VLPLQVHEHSHFGRFGGADAGVARGPPLKVASVQATGSAAAMQQGFAYVAHGGTYVLISVVSADITFSDPEFHKREMSLLASRNATIEDFDHVLSSIKAGQVPTAALNTHQAALKDLSEALPGWMEPSAGVIKAIVAC